MAWTGRITASCAGAALLVAGLSMSAGAASSKQPLVGPWANMFCSDVSPADDGLEMIIQDGFVIFNQADGNVSAELSLKNARPDTDYFVRLIQGGSGDCDVNDGVLHTNGAGNGNLHLQEPVVAPNTNVQIFVQTGENLGFPLYRAVTSYHLT